MAKTMLHSGAVLTLNDDYEQFDEGCVVFHDSTIVYVGGIENAPDMGPNDQVIDCRDQIVMPGLINTHTHTGMSFFRNLLEDLSSPDWFRNELHAERYLSREDSYWAALLGCYESLRQGVTTIADRFSHMDQVIKAIQHAGIRAIAAPSLVDRDSALRQRETLALIEQFGAQGDGLIRIGLGPVGPDTCSTELLRWTRDQAERHQAMIFIHLAQSRQELAEVARRGYRGAAHYLAAIDVLGTNVVAAHGMYLQPDEIDLLAANNVKIAHCPASNAKIEGKIAPIDALMQAGVAVGIGTDCAACNNTMDMFAEMKIAGLMNKVAAANPEVMPCPPIGNDGN